MASAKLNPGPNEHSSGNTTMLTQGNLVSTRAVSFSRRSRLSPKGKSTCNAAIENSDMFQLQGEKTKNDNSTTGRRLRNGGCNLRIRWIVDRTVIQYPSRDRRSKSSDRQEHERR